MLPPGKHYFYFVQKPEKVFLSAQYPIVRFKDTNMFVNRIELRPKKHEFTSVFTLKEGKEDEEVFLIDHSVFAKYECEQNPGRINYLRKAYEFDMYFSKMSRVCKSDDALLKELKNALWLHFDRL